MKNWATLLALLLLPSLALIGCASTDEDEPQDHYWQSEEEEGKKKKHKKHKEHDEDDEDDDMERDIYRDK